MPELPEVESAARLLASLVQGKTIVALRTMHPTLARRLTGEQAGALAGRRVERVERRGKHQLLHLDDGTVLHAHFRMTGDWEAVAPGAELPRHTRALLELADGTRVALVDSRALASLTMHESSDRVLPDLGPEPFDPALTPTTFGAALAARRGPIKPTLLDQRVIAGLGNIYAAEALWLARINPRAVARALGPERRARLLGAIRRVLRRASAGRYWADGRASPWRVYDREGKPCPRCRRPIRRIVQAGRSTYYCSFCQRA